MTRWLSRRVPAQQYLAILLCCSVFAAVEASRPPTTDARGRVYYTDYDSGPKVRPVIVDGSPNVRAGPFRRWRGWGTSTAKATVRYRNLHTTVVMRQIRRCRSRRQYRILIIYSYADGRKLGSPKRYINRACRRR